MSGTEAEHDYESIETAFVRHRQSLTRIAAQYVRCHADAQDVVQQVFAKMILSGHISIPAANIAAYLGLSVRREAIRILGKRCRSPATEPDRLIILSDTGQAIAAPAATNGGSDLLDELEQCRHLLSKAQADTLFSFLDGFSIAEIAGQAGVSIETTKTHYKRAVAKVRREREMRMRESKSEFSTRLHCTPT